MRRLDAAAPRDGVLNVHATYLFTFFYWAARSILFQQVIAGFVFVLTNSNQPVGIVKGVQGISQLVFSFPAGYIADHTRRDRVLHLSSVLGLAGALLTAIAVWECNLLMLNAAFAMWGLFDAFQSPAMEALFAESIPHGHRSYPFMIKYNVSNVAMVVGPLLSVLLFWYFGDNWRVSELQPVLLSGCLLVAVASLVLFRFNDDHTLGDEEDEEEVDDEDNVSQLSINPVAAAVRPRSYSHRSGHSEALRTPSVVGNDLEIEYDYSDEEEEETEPPTETSALMGSKGSTGLHVKPKTSPTPEPKFLFLRTHHVPWLIFLSDFIISNGAGMTIYFFPLFFKEEYGLSPIHVSLLFMVQPLLVAVLSLVAQQLSTTLGRMPVIVTTRGLSTICLLGMVFAQPLWVQITLFLLRGGTMRCSQPLRRSVLMDFVHKDVRARWNALEGVSVFSFSGSAVLGGYLVDAYDYRTCFLVTSLVYMAGVSIELFLLPLTKHAIEK